MAATAPGSSRRDPDFAAKAGRILDLYQAAGRASCCIPATTSSRRREALDPSPRPDRQTRAPGAGRRGQLVEHDLRAQRRARVPRRWDVRHGELFDRCEPKDGIEPFDRLVEQVMTTEPYASRSACSGSSTTAPRTAASVDRPPSRPLAEPDPRPHPVHAQLAQPDRDLLLDRPAQGAHPQRLRRPRPLAARLPTSSGPTTRSPTVRLEVHPRGPQRLAHPPRRPTSRLALAA